MNTISSLGYVRVRATDMDAWRTFAFSTIGFASGSGPEEEAPYLADGRAAWPSFVRSLILRPR